MKKYILLLFLISCAPVSSFDKGAALKNLPSLNPDKDLPSFSVSDPQDYVKGTEGGNVLVPKDTFDSYFYFILTEKDSNAMYAREKKWRDEYNYLHNYCEQFITRFGK